MSINLTFNYLSYGEYPPIDDKDLLLLVEYNGEQNYAIGYYRGEAKDGTPLFDNANYGWVLGNVLAWASLNEIEVI